MNYNLITNHIFSSGDRFLRKLEVRSLFGYGFERAIAV